MEREIIVKVGSENPVKIRAVESAFKAYGFSPRVSGTSAESGVHRQPKSIGEIILGAENRAKNSYSGRADFSVGLEGGIFRFHDKTDDYWVMNCAAVFDGKKFCAGLSPGFKCPPRVAKSLLTEDREMGEIFDEIAGEKNMKHKLGAVGILTNGIVPRDKMVELSVIMALAQIVNKKLYG